MIDTTKVPDLTIRASSKDGQTNNEYTKNFSFENNKRLKSLESMFTRHIPNLGVFH